MMTPLKYAAMIVAVLAVCAVGMLQTPAAAQGTQVQGKMTLTITDQGITGGADVTSGGLYVVTVRNQSSQARGLVIEGIDLCCSPYTRFTKVLDPGREVTFRWYFPADRDVRIRDLIQCKPIATTCGFPLLGDLSRSIMFT